MIWSYFSSLSNSNSSLWNYRIVNVISIADTIVSTQKKCCNSIVILFNWSVVIVLLYYLIESVLILFNWNCFLPAAHNAMNVCACFLINIWTSDIFGHLCNRLNSIFKKSLGVMAAKSHFNLLNTNNSQPCKISNTKK
jgi:hypothetical protein